MVSWKHLLLLLFFSISLHLAFAQDECSEGETQECVTEQECSGTQVCIDSEWSECVVDANVCEPGQSRACTPIISGIECPAIEGLQECNLCGDFWLECVAPEGAECCPGQAKTCDANGRKECTDEGAWGYCFDGDSCNGVTCKDDEVCTLDRCALGECVFIGIEKCCFEDSNCLSGEHCVENRCIGLGCGECFDAKRHECIPKKRGVCCNSHWNRDYSSCEFNYSVTEDRVESVDDERVNYFFIKGVKAVDEGLLDLARYSFLGAESAVKVAKQIDDYNDEVLSRINSSFTSIDIALDSGDYKAVKRLTNEVDDLLKLRKPPEEKPGTGDGKDGGESGLPDEEPAPETPWTAVIILGVILVFLFALLVVEIRKRKVAVLPAKPAEDSGLEGPIETE